MVNAFRFLEENEKKIEDFSIIFNRLLLGSLNRLKGQNIGEAIRFLEQAQINLERMHHVYEKQKEIERYLIKLDKKSIHDLKKEKHIRKKTQD